MADDEPEEATIQAEPHVEAVGGAGEEAASEAQEHGSREGRERKRKKRWGEETEAGRKILEDGSLAGAEAGATTEANGTAAEGGGGPEEGSKRKRKSRWEESKTIPGGLGAITLPPALAHLVDMNPESLELQRQLGNVSMTGLGGCSLAFLDTPSAISGRHQTG